MASVFFSPIETDAETAERVVKAACCLHNYIVSSKTNVAAAETEEHVASGPCVFRHKFN
jgi:hypothetical protein